MPRVLAFLLWSVVFCAALLLIDQFFVRIPQRQPALAAARTFYVDFRQRLLALPWPPRPPAPTSIENLIEREQLQGPPPAPDTSSPRPAATAEHTAPRPSAPVTAAPGQSGAAARTPTRTTANRETPPPATGYVYTDASGALQMVERLDQVPVRYRKNAQPLAE